MFFNYDSIPFLITGIIVSGLFSYSFYNIFITNNESLINTLPDQLSPVSTPNTLAENTIPIPVMDPTALPIMEPSNLQYVNVGVQTDVTSIWGIIKNWFLNAFSIRSSELGSLGQYNVNRWRNNLDSIQSVSLNDSETSLTSVISNSTVKNLIFPDDSASNINEVISESNLQEVASIYQINDFDTYNALISVPKAQFSHIIVDGVHQYFVKINNAILSVNPDILNYFSR